MGGHDNVLYEDWMLVGASRHPTNRLWALGGVNDYGVLCEDCARFAVPVEVYKKSPSERGFF